MRIAIPSDNPGGVDAPRSEHFGHCDIFTVVTIEDNKIGSVEVIPNAPHAQGGCLAPVGVLKDAEVAAIVVQGMGARPMQGFAEAGITVYYADIKTASDVAKVAELLVAGKLPVMRPSQSCQGSGHCSH